MNILGINAVFHESSAALMVDGEVVAACEEERFTRVKHAKEARVDNPHELPEQAIRFCLDYAGLQRRRYRPGGVFVRSQLRRAKFQAGLVAGQRVGGGIPAASRQGGRCRLDAVLGRRLGRALKFVPHHLAHAASAYYPSGFDPAAILVIDGIGEADCSMLARGEGARIETIETFSYPHSLGFVWEQVSVYLGFSSYDASKVMGLAAYGDPEVFRRQFASIIQVGDGRLCGRPRGHRLPIDSIARGLEALFGPRRQPDGGDSSSAHGCRGRAAGGHR